MVPLGARHERKGEPWRRGCWRAPLRLLSLLFAFCLFPLASAHPANVPSSRIKVWPDGTFTARIRFDAIAFATGATPREADDREMNALLDGPDEALAASLADAAGRFRRGFVAMPGGTIDRLEFPTVASVRRFLAGDPSPRLPAMLTALVWGRLPKGARTVAFRYPEGFDTVVQTVEIPYQEPASEPVDPGRVSSVLRVPSVAETARAASAFAVAQAAREGSSPRTVVKATPTVPPVAPARPPVAGLSVAAKDARQASATLEKPGGAAISRSPALPPGTTKAVVPKTAPAATIRASEPTSEPKGGASPVLEPTPEVATPSEAPAPSPLGLKVATYLRMGFAHILPEGMDHVLFVLGLFLLGRDTKALVKQITAFTVAHSITLALTALGVIHLPGRIIEPVIAISIAFVAIENLFTKEVRPSRTAVVFLFGLVHGMGFAEVFADAGLSGAGLLTAVLSFNVGVELGQLAVVAMAFAAVGWFRRDPRYRTAVVVPASLVIASVALFWSVQRILA